MAQDNEAAEHVQSTVTYQAGLSAAKRHGIHFHRLPHKHLYAPVVRQREPPQQHPLRHVVQAHVLRRAARQQQRAVGGEGERGEGGAAGGVGGGAAVGGEAAAADVAPALDGALRLAVDE